MSTDVKWIVRARSIPNVPTERLEGDLSKLHAMLHTRPGLHAHEGPRRELVHNGMKLRRIVAELVRRGQAQPDCPSCRLTGNETYLGPPGAR